MRRLGRGLGGSERRAVEGRLAPLPLALLHTSHVHVRSSSGGSTGVAGAGLASGLALASDSAASHGASHSLARLAPQHPAASACLTSGLASDSAALGLILARSACQSLTT